jgi:hypothetical protein
MTSLSLLGIILPCLMEGLYIYIYIYIREEARRLSVYYEDV